MYEKVIQREVRGWFITGTDTGVGKTFVAEALLRGLQRAGQTAVGMKPVASGCRATERGVRSDDAERLQAASSVACAYADINPYPLADPVAPHLAARAMGITIDIADIHACFARLGARAQWVVVEGIGGWRVPIDRRRTMAAVAASLGLPVILVVGLRLGCLNHALLTAAAISADGARLAGWIGNPVPPPVPRTAELIEALTERLPAPLLTVMPDGSSTQTPLTLEPAVVARLTAYGSI